MSLNARQKLFVQNLVKGMTQEKAYIKAGYSKNGARVASTKLLTNANILKYRDTLMQPKEDEAVMSRQYKREYLKEVTQQGEYAEGLRAVAEDNRMTGDYEPEQHNHALSGLDELLKRIRSEPTYIPPRRGSH